MMYVSRCSALTFMIDRLIRNSLIGGALMFAVGLVYLALEKSLLSSTKRSQAGLASTSADSLSRTIIGLQIGLILLAMLVTRSSVASLSARQGLPLGTQVVGWITLVASLTVPFLHTLQPNSNYVHRLVVLFLTFAPIFVILTIQYEGLFYLAFCATLVSWVRLEYRINAFTQWSTRPPPNTNQPSASNGKATTPPKAINGAATSPHKKATEDDARNSAGHSKTLTLTSLRTTLFFLYLLQSAFFSTGNIASISSFSLDAVYRLIPIFDPFSQTALLLLKLLIPFFFLSACLALLNAALDLQSGALCMLCSGVGEWLVMRFFWSVRDEGSWLEIGETITRFVIVSALGVFVAGLEVLGGRVVRGVGGFEGGSSIGAQLVAVEKADVHMAANGGKVKVTARGGRYMDD